jgi:protein required for attachment to host cells
MRNTRIWILITDGVSARICSTDDGSTVAITAPQEARSSTIGEPTHEMMDEAWYLRGGRNRLMRGTSAHFADHIAQILEEAATERAFDGLVIIAAPHIASEIERSLSLQARALMIGDVVGDLPAFTPAEPATRMDLWH